MSFDPTRVQYTPTWFFQAIVAVIMVLGILGIGTWAYRQLKGLAFDTGEDF